MSKNVTMGDIAKTLKVSIVTVSKALNNKEGVGKELRKKIIATADKMGYVYAGGTKKIPDKPAYTIGILVHEKFMDTAGNSFYWKVYQNINRALKEQGCFAILELIDEEAERNRRMSKIITDTKVDGLILLGQIRESYIEALAEKKIPVILVDFYNEDENYDSIISDSFYGAYTLTNHLIHKGHKRIGFVGNIHATSSILDRYLGYCKALIEHDIKDNESLTVDDRDEEGRYTEFNLPAVLPTAFVCNCDEVAYRLVNTLKEKGMLVPEDVSVVGFDNYLISTMMQPLLTTIEVNIEEMTQVAVEGIIKKIEDPEIKLGRRIINSNIIYRDSVKDINVKDIK